MKIRTYFSYIVLVGIVTVVDISLANAQTDEPIGPAKPAVIVNTLANPVPVSGQISIGNMPAVDARQSGAWIVGINGTPSVRLDPNGNTVQFAPRATTPIFDSGNLQYSEDGQPLTFGPLDVSAYSRIRVGINNSGSNDLDVIVRSGLTNTNPTLLNSFVVDKFEVENSSGGIERLGPSISRSYDVPGTKLYISVFFGGGAGATGVYRVVVAGN